MSETPRSELGNRSSAGAGALAIQPLDAASIAMLPCFSETPLVRRKKRNEVLAQCIFGAMTLSMILPLLAIISYLVGQAWPALSLNFILQNPIHGMREGGLWSPFLGTIYLVLISLLVS